MTETNSDGASAPPPPLPRPARPSLRPGEIVHETPAQPASDERPAPLPIPTEPADLPASEPEPEPELPSNVVALPERERTPEERLDELRAELLRDSKVGDLYWAETRLTAKEKHVRQRMAMALDVDLHEIRRSEFGAFWKSIPIRGRARDANFETAQRKRLESLEHALETGEGPFQIENGSVSVRVGDVRKFLVADGHRFLRNLDLFELLRAMDFEPARSKHERLWRKRVQS